MTRVQRRRALPLLLAALSLLAAPLLAATASTAEGEVALTYGIRAFQRGDLDEAVLELQGAVAAAPDEGNAHYWLGLTFLKRGDAAPAVRELEASLHAKVPPAVDRARVEADLQRARAAVDRKAGGETIVAPGTAGALLAVSTEPRFDLRLGVAYGRDSNPAELPDDVIASGPGIGTLRGEVKDRVTDLDLRAAAYPFYGQGGGAMGGWSLGLVGQVAAARFQDLDFLNERQWRGAVHLAWGSDPLGYLTGPLGYTRVPFGASRLSFLLQAGRTDTRVNGSPLVTADEAALALVCRETAGTSTQVEVDYQKLDLLDGAEDGRWRSAGVSQLFFLGRRDRFLRLGVARGKETDVVVPGDGTSTTGSAELALPLAERWTLQVAASRRKDRFDSGPLPEFEDTTSRAAATLSWQLVRHLYATGRASWAKRDSTLDLASSSVLAHRNYRRNTLSLGLQWLW